MLSFWLFLSFECRKLSILFRSMNSEENLSLMSVLSMIIQSPFYWKHLQTTQILMFWWQIHCLVNYQKKKISHWANPASTMVPPSWRRILLFLAACGRADKWSLNVRVWQMFQDATNISPSLKTPVVRLSKKLLVTTMQRSAMPSLWHTWWADCWTRIFSHRPRLHRKNTKTLPKLQKWPMEDPSIVSMECTSTTSVVRNTFDNCEKILRRWNVSWRQREPTFRPRKSWSRATDKNSFPKLECFCKSLPRAITNPWIQRGMPKILPRLNNKKNNNHGKKTDQIQ